MEVVHHGVAEPPLHEAYGVWVHLRHEELHFSSRLEGLGADIFRCEPDGSTGGTDDGTGGRSDFITEDLLTCLEMIYGGNGGVTGGAVLEKLCHLSTQFRHRKTLGVPCPTVPN